jgi:HK97 family phage major capsid protein
MNRTALSTPASMTRRTITTRERAADQPFDTLTDFMAAVRTAAVSPHDADVRLKAQRAQNTSIGADGGWAVPAPLLDRLYENMLSESVLYARVAKRPVTVGNTYTGVVHDESATTDGARHGGLQMPVVAEDATFTFSLPTLRRVTMTLTKHGTIIPASNEVVEDAQSFADDMEAIVGGELAFMLDRLCAFGLGGAQPLGLANAPSTVSVAIEGGQNIANTPSHIRVNSARLLARMRRPHRAIFLLHPDLIASALIATAGTANSAASFFGPATDEAPLGTLHNRPVFPLESAPAIGTPGDMLCVDPERYVVAQKGTLTNAVSPHVEFLNDVSLFRYSVRVNAQPMLSKSVGGFSSALPKSDSAVLAARA